MRIFNATKLSMSLPLPNGQVISISSRSVSGDIMASKEFLSTIVTSYNTDEVAFIVGGPYELNICASIPTVTEYVVQTLDEALQRFGLRPKEVAKKVVEPEEKQEVKETSEPSKDEQGQGVSNEEPEKPKKPKGRKPKAKKTEE